MKQWARTWLRTGALAAMVGAALLFVAAPRAKAQGGIAGTLLDLDGKPWADTTITLEGDQGAKTDTKTDNAGKYVFTGLKAGIYKLSVMLPFQKTPYVAGQVKVSGSDTVTAELNLLELVAKKNPEYAAAVKKQAEDLKKAGGMKAHFDAGVAKLDQVKDKKAALAKAPAEQRDALKQDLTDTATQAVTELEASKAAAPEKDSNLPLILSRLGDAYEAAGRSDDAIAAYKSAVEIKPTAPIYLNLGGIQGRAGKSDDAIASFQKAAELDPANAAQAWRNAGIILSNAGKYAEAVEPLKKSTELDPKSAIGWYLLGGALVANIKYKKVGDKDVPDIPAGTAEAYQHAIELDPNGPYGKESKAALDALQQMAPGITTRVTEKKKKP